MEDRNDPPPGETVRAEAHGNAQERVAYWRVR